MRRASFVIVGLCLAGCVSPSPRQEPEHTTIPTGWYTLGEDRPDYLYQNNPTNAPRLAVHDCAKLQLNTIPWSGNSRWETWIAPEGYLATMVSSSSGQHIATVTIWTDGTNVYLNAKENSRFGSGHDYVVVTNSIGCMEIRENSVR